MYRKKTLQPYERHLSNINLLDVITYNDSNHDSFKIDLSSMNKNFNQIFDEYIKARENKMLIQIEYSSIFEYLTLLEFVCKELDILKENAIVYLAAAVSDFYLPKSQMPKHKIQSNQGGLKLDLKPVPKVLGKLKSEWCPRAYVISFKLETDESLLISKSLKALDKYKHNLVIANILETRKNQVIIIEGEQIKQQHLIRLNEKDNYEIEVELIKYIINLHLIFLNKC
jgi:phosphopantothenate-cysteine ligase